MIEYATAFLTFALAFVIFTVVCLPMNERSNLEKMFLLCIGISVMAAGLDRVSHICSAYDLDGSVSLLAEVLISFSRLGAVICGSAWCLEFIMIRKNTTPPASHLTYAMHRKNN